MAYDVGGRGDQSFNDSAAAGLDKAKAEFGVEIQESAATNGEAESAREERLNQLIDAGYNNIVAVGFAYATSVRSPRRTRTSSSRSWTTPPRPRPAPTS
jgi:basic membrane protein A